MFRGTKYVPITDLGLSQIYLNRQKLLNVEKWFDPEDLSNFKPLPVHDFGNGRLTLTDGHSRAFVAYRHGVDKIPVVYDTDAMITSETGQTLYKTDILWCERFHIKAVCDLASRILSAEEYQRLWIDRCTRAYHLFTKTTEKQRDNFRLLHPGLFLYGANEDLNILFFENEKGDLWEFPVGNEARKEGV